MQQERLKTKRKEAIQILKKMSDRVNNLQKNGNLPAQTAQKIGYQIETIIFRCEQSQDKPEEIKAIIAEIKKISTTVRSSFSGEEKFGIFSKIKKPTPFPNLNNQLFSTANKMDAILESIPKQEDFPKKEMPKTKVDSNPDPKVAEEETEPEKDLEMEKISNSLIGVIPDETLRENLVLNFMHDPKYRREKNFTLPIFSQWAKTINQVSLQDCFEINLKGIELFENLKYLNLPKCYLTKGSETFLQRLKNLKSLTLGHIPAIVANLSLESLEICGRHGVPIIDKNFEYIPKGLKHLNIGRYDLSTIPEEIKNLTNLEILNLGGNPIKKGWENIPPSVSSLGLENCGLEKIPEEVKNLPNLKGIFLQKNPNLWVQDFYEICIDKNIESASFSRKSAPMLIVPNSLKQLYCRVGSRNFDILNLESYHPDCRDIFANLSSNRIEIDNIAFDENQNIEILGIQKSYYKVSTRKNPTGG